MSSLFKLNQLSTHQEAPTIIEEPKTALETSDREIYALRQQLQTLKTLYKNAKAQNETSAKRNADENPIDSEYSKQRIEKLMAVLAEREKQMRGMQADVKQQQALALDEWQKERQAKLIALEEIAALHGQLEFLKTKVASSQNVIKTQQEQLQSLQEEHQAVVEKLQVAEVIADQKIALELAHEALVNKATNLTEELVASKTQTQELNDTLLAKEKQHADCLEKIAQLEKSLFEADQNLQIAAIEKARIQENYFKAQSAQEDSEARLKIAHYHLAKKVKETTQLSDKARDLEGQEHELTTDLKFAHAKIAELQKLLEEQFFQEKRRQEHLQDSLQDTEALAGAWEKKYFELYADWQAHDIRLKEFKALEEKLFQMKSLWMSFGQFFNETGFQSINKALGTPLSTMSITEDPQHSPD